MPSPKTTQLGATPVAATSAAAVGGTIQGPAIAPLSMPMPAPAAPVPGGVELSLTPYALPDARPDPRLVLMIDPDSERAAAYRVLRHHLLERGRPQVVIVSSAGAGDGKTTTALNLAMALGECGRARVLLVETHLRRPQLAQILGTEPPWCFAEQVIAHRAQPHLGWSFLDVPALGLHVGPVSPRVDRTQLLDGPAFAFAMERLRQAGYDHIIVDAPAVLGSADVNLMAEAADTVLLAVRARHTTARDVRRAVDQLGAAKVAGTVLVEG